jgi:hypothetical protein
MSQPDARLPATMRAEIAAFAEQIRQTGTNLYGELVRENIAGAIRCSFPMAVGALDEGRLGEAIDHFISSHPSIRPQFHEIATEFLIFTQNWGGLPQSVLPILEYEWTLLQVEIDAAQVPTRPDIPLRSYSRVTLNPTLRVVLLPFDVFAALETDRQNTASPRPHAIYRTASHDVMTRMLSASDCLMMDALHNNGPLVPSAVAAIVADELKPSAADWISLGVNDEILCIADQKGNSR